MAFTFELSYDRLKPMSFLADGILKDIHSIQSYCTCISGASWLKPMYSFLSATTNHQIVVNTPDCIYRML